MEGGNSGHLGLHFSVDVGRFGGLLPFPEPVATIDPEEGGCEDDADADDSGGRDDVAVDDAGEQERDDLTQGHDNDEDDRT